MPSKSQMLYEAYHSEFEDWFTEIHPNHNLTFEWEPVWDSGWYKENTANGAWIAWLELTGKMKASNKREDKESTRTNSAEYMRTIKYIMSPDSCRTEDVMVYSAALKDTLDKACPRTLVDVIVTSGSFGEEIIVSGWGDKENEIIEAIRHIAQNVRHNL